MAGVDALVDAFQAAFAGRDRYAFAGCCAPDVHYEDPVSGGPLVGLDALAGHAARMWAAFPDAAVETAGARLTDGRFVAAPVRVTGTHRGEVARLPATNRAIALHAVLYCELTPDGEALWRVRAFYDAYAAAVQLGVLPKAGTIGERALLMLRGFGIRD
ncbi:MAG: ester cyclase [Solirubrobacteraceae bacterium]|nr:ester cyclase [Solirubrobacteraceae bacterium]